MKYFLIALGSTLLFLTGCSPSKTAEYINPEDVSYEVQEETEITDREAVQEAVQVIEDNLAYAEEEDMDGYLSTIVSSAHENTRSELEAFFELYDLEHTVLGITVLEQDEESMLIEVFQQTVAVDQAEEADDYRDHLGVANHTLILEDGEWKISETVMTDNFFIEE